MKKIIMLLLLGIMTNTVQAAQQVDELVIFCSGGLRSTLTSIADKYQKQTGISLNIKEAPSMGNTYQSIPNRLARQEPADVLVLVADAIKPLQEKHIVDNNSRKDIADSYIAMAVKKGAIIPKIATPKELRQTLLDAKSIAYSDSASGKYLSQYLFKKLAVANQIKDKAHMIPATPVGEIVAQGKAEIGFQQYSELLPIKGISIVGLIPDSIQKSTRYAAIVVANSTHKKQANAFINYLVSKEVSKIIESKGLKPLTRE